MGGPESRTRGKGSGGWLSSKWSPVTPLTDREYEKMLEDKILNIDAQVALIDDRIAELRAQQQKPGSGTESLTTAEKR